MAGLTAREFARKWQDSTLKERSGSQEHFTDLCRMLGHGTPAEIDPQGRFFTFEKGAAKHTGGEGWADVWYKDHFAWEYKGKHANLAAAYDQLLNYREDLESPPLLIVCDMDRFEVHCNFTGSAKRAYRFDLAAIAEGRAVEIVPPADKAAAPTALNVLRAAFTDPAALRPEQGKDIITQTVAGHIGSVADDLRRRKIEAQRAAHFLMKILFCFFAEDIDLLPKKIFTQILDKTRNDPDQFVRYARELFDAMASGGHVLLETIPHFDGGLFADDEVIRLLPAEIEVLHRAARMDWASVEPAIFGTLFERCLDPDKHAQIGRHYTYDKDIADIVEPVVVEPLQREWAAVVSAVEKLEASRKTCLPRPPRDRQDGNKIEKAIRGFQDRLASLRILDPACGSGNFLYVALRRLLDLEKRVVNFAFQRGIELSFQVRPTQLHGMEINRFAHELASVVVWIGYLQWMRDNGAAKPNEPILEPIETIHLMDAIVAETEDGPKEPDWPDADFIIGNPPFLGGKKLRTDLGDGYVDAMFEVWSDRVPREADLCCYWFEKARACVERGSGKHRPIRAGLLATQGIRGRANRKVLQRIKQTGDIFMAWSDRPWILEGAAVRVSMVGFDDGTDTSRSLDGEPAAAINSDLSARPDITTARRLSENAGISFMGDTKGGAFDIDAGRARELLTLTNPHGKPNSDVVRPWVNGWDITRRPRDMCIIDFGCSMAEREAALYEGPFEYVKVNVRPVRLRNRRQAYRERWWIHVEPRPAMRKATDRLDRFVATPVIAKHRLFVWLAGEVLPDHQLIVFARADDYFFGVLQSRVHEVWAGAQGTQLESRPRYTPTTCFETFPFPWPVNRLDPPREKQPVHARISAAAARLNELREGWLSPEPGSISGKDLKRRTLTNLYNRRPTWLANAHAELDGAVLEAYAWPAEITDDEILARLLELNLSRCSASIA